MKTPRIYVDTSVAGGCEDKEFAEARLERLAQARSGRIKLLISELLMMELARAPEAVQIRLAALPPACVEYLADTAEARALQGCYAVNLREGYRLVDIRSPLEIV